MRLIRLFFGDTELNFVKETLTIKKENNAFVRDFKISHSSVPFLMIEDSNCKKALGSRDITSIGKPKTVQVTVYEGGEKYYGELQVISYSPGFRKCNLKYASELLQIFNRKIGEFMPVVSVIPGETDPIPYTETVTGPIAEQGYWANYHLPFIGNSFPDVKWNFPTMAWPKKFGVPETVSEDWYFFEGEYNRQVGGFMLYNDYVSLPGGRQFDNRNIISPQVYLLSPLFYALQSIGHKASGGAYENPFLRRLLMLSLKDNMSEVLPEGSAEIDLEHAPIVDSRETYSYITTRSGLHTFRFKSTEIQVEGDINLGDLVHELYIRKTGGNNIYGYRRTTYRRGETYEGTMEVQIEPSEIGTEILIRHYQRNHVFPSPFSLQLEIEDINTGHQAHPTIELKRYLPDWTFGQYLNELKNFFNMEIILDNLNKELRLEFNEERLSSGKKEVLRKSLAVGSYDQAAYNAFLLKYENDDDPALWITSAGAVPYVSQVSEFSLELQSKFKLVPVEYTAMLSEELEDKDGVGLMVYDPANSPYVSGNYLGQHLGISGQDGIYETYWKKWLKFRLNASVLELSGPFTEVELGKILLLNRIYVDRQEYLVVSTEYGETDQGNFDVRFKVESLNY
jgi:hypothetical protein